MSQILQWHPAFQAAMQIGRIFKRYNILEYKSPEKSHTVNSFFKVVRSSFSIWIYKLLFLSNGSQLMLASDSTGHFRSGVPPSAGKVHPVPSAPLGSPAGLPFPLSAPRCGPLPLQSASGAR